jgi:hypothetical protein
MVSPLDDLLDAKLKDKNQIDFVVIEEKERDGTYINARLVASTMGLTVLSVVHACYY